MWQDGSAAERGPCECATLSPARPILNTSIRRCTHPTRQTRTVVISTVPGMETDAKGGLKIGIDAHDLTGAWGRSATNKRCRVYTGALLATAIST